MSPVLITVSKSPSARMSETEMSTRSGEGSTVSIPCSSSAGDPGETPEGSGMYNYATARFLSDEVQPYVPVGIFDLHMDPRLFLDANERPAAMARHLNVLLQSSQPGGTTTSDDNDHGPASSQDEEVSVDDEAPVEASYDNASLLSLSDDDEPADRHHTS